MNYKISMKKLGLLIIILAIMISSAACFNKKTEVKEEPQNFVEPPVENSQTPEQEPTKQEENTEAEEETKVGVFPGDKAYDFSLLDREGNEIKLSDLKGKVVFLNFWASWCGPCVMEMPAIQEIYERYQDKDVAILGVNALASEREGKEGVDKFIDENGYTFPILYDVDSTAGMEYKVRALPTTYIINKEGIISEMVVGSMDAEAMIEKIEKALNE